jgi:Tfp pilus assembly pilus retraction ATPase PilT
LRTAAERGVSEHVHLRSLVEQVEIGVDAPDFPTALRAAVRQGPDVIVVGEMRVPAAELLVLGYDARQHIRKNALQHLHQEITITCKAGSFTLEESLVALVRNGWIERNEAMLRAGHLQELESALAAAGL